MNAVEKLEAAIVQLEQLKSRGTPGPWSVSLRELRAPEPHNGFALVTWANPPHDADLIVTLHRTIDPQLAILRFGVARLKAVRALTGKHAEAHAHEAALADAILGES